MRSRNIKPGFFTNADLLECEPLARLLFIGLWCMADREGRLEYRPKKIAIEIMPADNCDIEALLGQLEQKGFIIIYEVLGSQFIQVVNFLIHQSPHQNENDSFLPKIGATKMPVRRKNTRRSSKYKKYQSATRHAPNNSESNPADIRIDDVMIPDLSLSSDKSRSVKLAFDSLPHDWGEWANGELGWSAVIIQDVWISFRDYWQARSGKSAQKSDWAATWRNWCRQQRIPNNRGSYATNFNSTTQGARASKSERARAALIESANQLGYAPDGG